MHCLRLMLERLGSGKPYGRINPIEVAGVRRLFGEEFAFQFLRSYSESDLAIKSMIINANPIDTLLFQWPISRLICELVRSSF